MLHQKTTSNLILQYTLKSRISQEFDLSCFERETEKWSRKITQSEYRPCVDTHSIHGPDKIRSTSTKPVRKYDVASQVWYCDA